LFQSEFLAGFSDLFISRQGVLVKRRLAEAVAFDDDSGNKA
jgi:hypothetical protein